MDAADSLAPIWHLRQELLTARLEELGASGLDYRADLALGRFWWQRADGRPVAVASTRILMSYALSNQSVLCGWANPSFPPHATVPPVEGIPDRVAECTEDVAWTLAFRIADAVGAHFVYRAATLQHLSFLALWDVRAAAASEERFQGGSPWNHVRDVLAAFTKKLDLGEDIAAVARGYGRTFMQDHPRRGTALEAPLRAVGEKMDRLAGLPPHEQRARIAELEAEVARLAAS